MAVSGLLWSSISCFFANSLTYFPIPKRILAPSPIPFESSVLEGSAPVISRLHRINPILAKEVDATLKQYLAAGLIQHSTSPSSASLVVIRKTSSGVRITVDFRSLMISADSVSCPSRAWIRSWLVGKRRVFSLFDLVLPFHPATVHKYTVLFTAV